jgi:hypothetical protein
MSDQNEKPKIKIQPTGVTTVEFDVSIKGISAKDSRVNFIIEKPQFCYKICCNHVTENTWSVSISSDTVNVENNDCFVIEVIAENYFFEPVRGTIEYIEQPKVEIKNTTSQQSSQPTVSVQFNTQSDPQLCDEETDTVDDINNDDQPPKYSTDFDQLEMLRRLSGILPVRENKHSLRNKVKTRVKQQLDNRTTEYQIKQLIESLNNNGED